MSHHVAGVPGLDPTLPDVSLILGGNEYHLCYDHNAIVLAEKVTGINLLKAAVGDQSGTTIRGLLWAALLKEHPKLTIEEVGAWITPRNTPTIHQALIMAWFGSIPEPDKDEETTGEAEAQAMNV